MCDCIQKFDEHLKEFNTKIEFPLWTGSGVLSPFIQTIKISDKKRGKPKSVMASHCPFCGEKYAKPLASAEQRVG